MTGAWLNYSATRSSYLMQLLSLSLYGAIDGRNYMQSSFSWLEVNPSVFWSSAKHSGPWAIPLSQYLKHRYTHFTFLWFKGWMTRQIFFGLSESVCLKTYLSGIKVKNTVKSWNSQMNFHSVEVFPCDVNCRKRHHSGSTLLHMRVCVIGSQTPTSTTFSHFWLLGSKYEHEMRPKRKQIPMNSLSLAYS